MSYTYWTQMKSKIHWTPQSGLHNNDEGLSVWGKNDLRQSMLASTLKRKGKHAQLLKAW